PRHRSAVAGLRAFRARDVRDRAAGHIGRAQRVAERTRRGRILAERAVHGCAGRGLPSDAAAIQGAAREGGTRHRAVYIATRRTTSMNERRARCPRLVQGVVSLLLGIAPIARAQSRVLDVDGARIHYTVSGQGRAVVLLHGWANDIRE